MLSDGGESSATATGDGVAFHQPQRRCCYNAIQGGLTRTPSQQHSTLDTATGTCCRCSSCTTVGGVVDSLRYASYDVLLFCSPLVCSSLLQSSISCCPPPLSPLPHFSQSSLAITGDKRRSAALSHKKSRPGRLTSVLCRHRVSPRLRRDPRAS